MISSFFDFLKTLTTPDKLIDFLSTVMTGWSGYALLFGIVFAETGLLAGFFLPGDSLLFTVGVVAGAGRLDITTIIILLAVAAITGDAVGYLLGRKAGPMVFDRPNSHFFKREHLDRTREFYEKHGGKTIIYARFVPIVRTFAPFVAGVGNMSYARFATFNIFGGIGWVLLLTLLGYWLGGYPAVKNNFEKVILGIVLVSVLPILFEYFKSRNGRLNQKSMRGMTQSAMATLAALVCTGIPAALLLRAQSHADFPAPLFAPPTDLSLLNDPIAQLLRRIDAGKTRLQFDRDRGFLPSFLKELSIPQSSQVLVFSKTSLQHRFINPKTPRAIYFNDNVYAGFVPDGFLMELSAVDPKYGAVFYTLDQSQGSRPRLIKNADCVQCHSTPATMNIPGHIVRSVFTRADGQVATRAKSFLTDDRSPLEQRWGGWFVSGTVNGDQHMGNAILHEGEDAETFDRAPGTQIRNVARMFHSERYLTAESDVVALLVLEHQAHLHNLISRLRFNSSQQAPADAEIEEMLRYLLFVDEAPLHGTIAGATKYAAEFEKLGPRDTKGRSLRQFDLQTRMFRYPCSYLIYSEAFRGLPVVAKDKLYTRLVSILGGRDQSAAFSKLSAADRKSVAEILVATHNEFAAVWKTKIAN